MEEESFSPEESLKLISSMIRTAKSNFYDSSRYYLLWGYAVILASLALV